MEQSDANLSIAKRFPPYGIPHLGYWGMGVGEGVGGCLIERNSILASERISGEH